MLPYTVYKDIFLIYYYKFLHIMCCQISLSNFRRIFTCLLIEWDASVFSLTNFFFSFYFLSSMFQIKKLDPTSKRVSTIAGTGKAGFRDGTALAAQVVTIF